MMEAPQNHAQSFVLRVHVSYSCEKVPISQLLQNSSKPVVILYSVKAKNVNKNT